MGDPTSEPSSITTIAATIGGTLASVFAGWRFMRTSNSNAAVSEASNSANIEAINTYKELVESLQTKLDRAEQRADKFAEERNSAQSELYKALGKIEAMADQIMALNDKITRLESQIAALQKVPQ